MRCPIRIGFVVVMALLALTARATAQSPTPVEERVAPELVTEGRVALPGNGDFAVPDSQWEWRTVRVGEVRSFVIAKIGAPERILVMHQSFEHLNDEFMRGFVNGSLRRSAAQGIVMSEPSFAPGDFPVKGSYRFEAHTELPNGIHFTRAGYVLPTGYVVMMSFQGSEPAELKAVAGSYRPRRNGPDRERDAPVAPVNQPPQPTAPPGR